MLESISNPLLNAQNKIDEADDWLDNKIYEEVEVVFENGEDLSSPESGAGVDAPPDGASALNVSKPIEFIHYGFVYRDKASWFAHKEISDLKTLRQTPLRSRGIMIRSALQRECVLLHGMIFAFQQALDENEQQKGGIGSLISGLAGFAGGAAAPSNYPAKGDLDPMLIAVRKAADKISPKEIKYEDIHQAGIDLHKTRAEFRNLLATKLQNLRETPAEGSTGLLDSIPLVGPILPAPLLHIFALVQHWESKVFDIYIQMVMDLTYCLQPAVEGACKTLSVKCIRENQTPTFPVWFPPPPPEEEEAKKEEHGSEKKKSSGSDPLAAAAEKVNEQLDKITSKIDDAVNKVNNTVEENVTKPAGKVLDFLSRPVERAPGGPFLELAFQMPMTAALETRSDAFGTIAEIAFTNTMGFRMPGLVETLVREVSTTCGDFLRAAFGVLISHPQTEPLVEDELVAAGRRHFINQLLQTLVNSVGFLENFRNLSQAVGAPPIVPTTVVSGDAVIGRVMELVNDLSIVKKPIDAIVEFAMRDLASRLNALRASHQHAMTMEVYLSAIPVEFAHLFRNVFFRLWEFLVDTILAPITNALNPVGDVTAGLLPGVSEKISGFTNKMSSAVGDLRNKVNKVDNLLMKAQSVASETYNLADNPINNANKIGQAWEDGGFHEEASPEAVAEAPVSKILLQQRVPDGKAKTILKDEYEKVKKDQQWKAEKADSKKGKTEAKKAS
jgi:hypothetical protein